MSRAQVSMAAIFALYFFAPSVTAWGGLFNRFSPEMLSNLGYGGRGGYGTSRNQPFQVSYTNETRLTGVRGVHGPGNFTTDEHCKIKRVILNENLTYQNGG